MTLIHFAIHAASIRDRRITQHQVNFLARFIIFFYESVSLDLADNTITGPGQPSL